MRFSAPVKKHWLGSFSIVLPPSDLRDAGAAREPGGRGPGRGGGGGARDPRAYIYIYVYIYMYIYIYIYEPDTFRVYLASFLYIEYQMLS